MSQSIAFLLAVSLAALPTLGRSSQRPGAPGQEAAAAAPPSAPTVQVEQNVTYASVSGATLHLDVYEPAEPRSQALPAVVLIHGGGWSSLDKSTMRTMGQFLAKSGFVAFAVDYRLYQNHENGWPAQLDDVQRSVRWIRANAAKYGVNPGHIGAFGHSSGAQLAALLGMEDTRDNSDPALAKYSSRVQAVVDVSGPTDFTVDHVSHGGGFLSSFLGATYEQDPEVWRQASPAFHISKQDAPFLIVHGTQDESVPLSQSRELSDKLQSAGVPVSLITVNDAHTFQTPEARRQLAIQTLAFFDRYLAG
jgi:acetyl esterase/lipase